MSEISQDESTKKRCLEKKRTSIAKAVIGRIYYTQSRMDKEGCLRGGWQGDRGEAIVLVQPLFWVQTGNKEGL